MTVVVMVSSALIGHFSHTQLDFLLRKSECLTGRIIIIGFVGLSTKYRRIFLFSTSIKCYVYDSDWMTKEQKLIVILWATKTTGFRKVNSPFQSFSSLGMRHSMDCVSQVHFRVQQPTG